MSNGAACCILGVCCPPNKQQEALAKFLLDSFSTEAIKLYSEGTTVNKAFTKDFKEVFCKRLAKDLLNNFALVPKGVERSIINRYDKLFEQKYKNLSSQQILSNNG